MTGLERIARTFAACRGEGRAALVTYLMGGDPDPATSQALALACAAGGADLLEIGIPFSDPVADGPTIQRAGERALAAGTTLAGVLRVAAGVRRRSEVPIALMGYVNPILARGEERFLDEARAAGVDALVIPDLPPEEAGPLAAAARARGIALVFLLAPTSTPARRAAACAAASGFLYFVSVTGVTGARRELSAELPSLLAAVRARSPVPVVVGFGVSTPRQARALGQLADGVVVGSALVERLARPGRRAERAARARRFVASLAAALRAAALLALLALLPRPARATEEVVLKLGTLAPQGSSWHGLLREMGERWSEASAGRVKLRVYAGGTQGGEGDMVRKMGVGQLQASAITNVGMRDILPEPAVFTAPGMLDGEEEYRALLSRVRSRLEALLAAKGYVVVHWIAVGTAYVFCNRGYRSPAEMGEARLFVWEGDPAAVEAFRAVGFRPVVLTSVDLVPALQTGMVTCVTQPPAYALAARTFEKANHMMDYPWAWLMGATLVRRDAWERIPAELRPRLLAIAGETAEKLDAESRRLAGDAVAAMRKQGLSVFPVDGAAWKAAAERAWPATRGKVVPADFFDEVVRARDEVRRRAGR